ncbi:hypothetical protein INR49_013765, partial [Caranx melampygus]
MCCSASEMCGGKYQLLFTVFVLLETCQSKPQVIMSPQIQEIFSGDSFSLNCTNGGSGVTWFFNSAKKDGVNEIWKIPVAFPQDSGSYHCQSNGETSDSFTVKVLDLVPKASLTIKTGHPVMQFGHSVILQLHNDDGLEGWMCHVYREARNEMKTVKFRLENNNTVVFQTKQLRVPETIYWCTDQAGQSRSNQIVLRASAHAISLEMYPQPAVLGESLVLKCLVWGTDRIKETVFSKDGKVIERGTHSTYTISKVTESTKGEYQCNATYRHTDQAQGPPYQKESQVQVVLVQNAPMKASLSESKGSMSCSCSMPECHGDARCYWYYGTDGAHVKHLNGWESCHESANKDGYYACRLVWEKQRSELSASHYVAVNPISPIIIAIIIFVVLVGTICIVIAIYRYKRRSATSQIYEDMPMREREYDVLTKGSDAKRETEYDTLQPQAPDKDKTTGEYEALKKDGAKDEVYHTLGGEGQAAGGEGGYEALKKGGVKEEVYHTLKAEVVATEGGDGGYEALKKEGMKEGVYHTLKAEVVATEGGDGGYEALKKEGMKEGVYHTLGEE